MQGKIRRNNCLDVRHLLRLIACLRIKEKLEQKKEILSPVIRQRNVPRTPWDRISLAGEKGSPPIFLRGQSVGVSQNVQMPPELFCGTTVESGKQFDDARPADIIGEGAKTTPRTNNARKSSKDIASAIKGIVGPRLEKETTQSTLQSRIQDNEFKLQQIGGKPKASIAKDYLHVSSLE
ncbi:hypothetical protein IV203_011635 [Nitzschia inconspicua]|uniref:Uncharacterized protein n=1 Tax=Nitzschia inconspicua TaxID=303405 RepID=A0A9K3KU15_9STRA|nr:hypothetical protein IV203_011635 [Nitzschia inconspicua]